MLNKNKENIRFRRVQTGMSNLIKCARISYTKHFTDLNFKIKDVFSILVICTIISCTTTNKIFNTEGQSFKSNTDIPYAIVVDTVIKNLDTFYTSELRIYEIASSLDATKMMYKNYGDWSGEHKGKYQENINQCVWLDVDLNNDGRKYIVITDGTETLTEYFTSLIIFDSDTKNCFQYDYPKRQEMIDLVMEKMNEP